MSTLASEPKAPETPTKIHGLPPAPKDGRRRAHLARLVHWYKDPITFVAESSRELGPLFTYNLPIRRKPHVVLTEPEHVRALHTLKPDAYTMAGNLELLSPLVGTTSILTIDGKRHARKRKLLLPPFHGERMRHHAEIILRRTDAHIDRFTGTMRLADLFRAITLDLIIGVIIGIDDPTDAARLHTMADRLMKLGMRLPMVVPALRFDLGPLNAWGRFLRLHRACREIFLAQIEKTRKAPEGRTDILTMFVEAKDEHGGSLSDEEIVDEMFTMLAVGTDTTATTCSWTAHFAFSRPDIVERLEREIEEATGGAPLGPEHVSKLQFTEACINEALRLQPMFPFHSRELVQPLELGDYVIPAGTVLTAAACYIHRREDLWPEPDTFNPDRFMGKKPRPYTYFPFGGGARRCIGEAFGLYEATLIIARLVQRGRTTLLKPNSGHKRTGITLVPKDGVPARFEPRRVGTA